MYTSVDITPPFNLKLAIVSLGKKMVKCIAKSEGADGEHIFFNES